MYKYPFDSRIGAPILDPNSTAILRGDYVSPRPATGTVLVTLGELTATSDTGMTQFFGLLLQGDMQSGTDVLLLQGDMQSGSDKFLSQEVS
jgi:hypothetical protein